MFQLPNDRFQRLSRPDADLTRVGLRRRSGHLRGGGDALAVGRHRAGAGGQRGELPLPLGANFAVGKRDHVSCTC